MIATLQNLVAKLKLNAWIYAKLGARIYIGEPMDIPSDMYMTINIISQNQNIEVNNRTRVEFRIIWKEGSNFLDLDTTQNLILDYIKINYLALWFFKFEISNYYTGITDLKRYFALRDLVLYTITI